MDGPMILVVDDQPNNIKVLLSFLRNHNFQTRIAESGERALQLLDRLMPDLILLDVMMPGMNGFETCRKIKTDRQKADIPIIFMTALDNVEDKVLGFEAGGVDYITKPFDQAEMLSRIKTHIELRKKTLALQKSEKQIRMIVENAPISIHELDLQGNIISMNAAGLKMIGIPDGKEILATNYRAIVNETDLLRVNHIFDKACQGEICQFEFRTRGENNQVVSARLVPIKDKQGQIERLLGICEDITEQKESEEKVRQMAFLDGLTGLPNRRLLEDRIKHIKTQSERTARYNALIYLDLDNFKPLNDTWGHKAGDLFLMEIAQRLTQTVRKMDTVSRIGGDEFVVLLTILGKDSQQATEQAARVSQKVLAAVSQPCQITLDENNGGKKQKISHTCTASIGVAVFAGDKIAGTDEILKWADEAMYKAKNAGKNTIKFYERP
ncbi:diguanylate cyclase [uncultured Desulfobacter sp.]|uniref:diguanylate cyclase n=1 Tax=uncultured Desulfobacter sp. TaxID=240139 RepID=UPI002AAC48C6|nr:diguanylate cyclase [uncultured Desulfobacter sp.]